MLSLNSRLGESSWRSRQEFSRETMLWSHQHCRLMPPFTDQLCDYTGCLPEDIPNAAQDQNGWREWIRDIRANSTWWWLWAGESSRHFSSLTGIVFEFCQLLSVLPDNLIQLQLERSLDSLKYSKHSSVVMASKSSRRHRMEKVELCI